MKLLLLVLLIVGIAMHWRRSRAHVEHRRPGTVPPPEPVVACARCGVHVALAQTVTGRKGTYCCLAHRTQSES